METVSEPTEKVLGSLVDRKTAARLLGVSKMHITNLIDSGQLRAFDVAVTGSRYRQVRIPVCELKKFLMTGLVN